MTALLMVAAILWATRDRLTPYERAEVRELVADLRRAGIIDDAEALRLAP